jgi:DUF1680 family protein
LTDLAEVTDPLHNAVVGPVAPALQNTCLRPLPLAGVSLGERGWWGQWQARNRLTTLPYGVSALESAGNLDNFRRLIGESDAPYRGFAFNDTDVYKTLEAVAWVLASHPDAGLDAYVDAVAGLMSRSQQPDGYLNTYVQGTPGKERYSHLAESHELYSAGHLFQAAIADNRSTGKRRLLDIALRFADHLVQEFGAGRRTDYDGHPEVETALVELYRLSGNQAYLDLAKQFIDDRGQRIFVSDGRGSSYFQDEVPVRDATSMVGHAVRALYLEAGVVDVATETADAALLASSQERWHDMVSSKLYVTGGVGSRHKSEGFGDPYELPPDRAYCETCAAIASIQWNWRLLLATGEAAYADLIERTIYNGFASSTGLDGTSFFYSNPLQIREKHEASDEEESGRRLPWYACACCPPNVMRLVASLQHYVASSDPTGLQIHQYTDAELDGRDTAAAAALSMRTQYPWLGAVDVRVTAAGATPWTLSLRIPAWVPELRVTVNGDQFPANVEAGYLRIKRSWVVGDVVALVMDMPPRITAANPMVDAIRGCVAIERGPLVYCLEAIDNPAVDLAAVSLDIDKQLELVAIPTWPDAWAIEGEGAIRAAGDSASPLYAPPAHREVMETQVNLTAVPYYLWANRANGPMRVWLPSSQ